ncbi:MAG: flagellar basal body P-ring formation chaperone FlgA [bacterium]
MVLWMLFTLGAGILPAGAQGEPVVIRLPDTYHVASAKETVIRLGDLAESIQSPDPETQRKYEELPVMKAPAPGEQDRLPRHYILQAVRSAGLDVFNVQFTGANLVEVYGYGRKIGIQEVLKSLQQMILNETGWSEDELVMRVISTPARDVWISPTGPVDIAFDRASPMVHGTTRYQVRLFIDQIQVKEFPIVLSVQHRRKAFLPVRNLKRGDVIGPDDIREAVLYFDNEMLDQQTVDNRDEITGRQCRIALTPGDPVKWQDLNANYVMKRGDPVQIVLKSDGLTLQTQGHAQGRGAAGDIIPVKTANTGRIVKGRIIQRGLVELVQS